MKAKSNLEIATAVLEKIKKEVRSSADTINIIEFETVRRKMAFSIQNLISFIKEFGLDAIQNYVVYAAQLSRIRVLSEKYIKDIKKEKSAFCGIAATFLGVGECFELTQRAWFEICKDSEDRTLRGYCVIINGCQQQHAFLIIGNADELQRYFEKLIASKNDHLTSLKNLPDDCILIDVLLNKVGKANEYEKLIGDYLNATLSTTMDLESTFCLKWSVIHFEQVQSLVLQEVRYLQQNAALVLNQEDIISPFAEKTHYAYYPILLETIQLYREIQNSLRVFPNTLQQLLKNHLYQDAFRQICALDSCPLGYGDLVTNLLMLEAHSAITLDFDSITVLNWIGKSNFTDRIKAKLRGLVIVKSIPNDQYRSNLIISIQERAFAKAFRQASAYGYELLVDILLKLNKENIISFDINEPSKTDNFTALDWAIRSKNVSIQAKLISAGATTREQVPTKEKVGRKSTLEIATSILKKIKNDEKVKSSADIIDVITLREFGQKFNLHKAQDLLPFIERFGLDTIESHIRHEAQVLRFRILCDQFTKSTTLLDPIVSSLIAITFCKVGTSLELSLRAYFEIFKANKDPSLGAYLLALQNFKATTGAHYFLLIGPHDSLHKHFEKLKRLNNNYLGSLEQLPEDCVLIDLFFNRVGAANKYKELIGDHLNPAPLSLTTINLEATESLNVDSEQLAVLEGSIRRILDYLQRNQSLMLGDLKLQFLEQLSPVFEAYRKIQNSLSNFPVELQKLLKRHLFLDAFGQACALGYELLARDILALKTLKLAIFNCDNITVLRCINGSKLDSGTKDDLRNLIIMESIPDADKHCMELTVSISKNSYAKAFRQACAYGCESLVDTLLELNKEQIITFDINERSETGQRYTALDWATLNKHGRIIKKLTLEGARTKAELLAAQETGSDRVLSPSQEFRLFEK